MVVVTPRGGGGGAGRRPASPFLSSSSSSCLPNRYALLLLAAAIAVTISLLGTSLLVAPPPPAREQQQAVRLRGPRRRHDKRKKKKPGTGAAPPRGDERHPGAGAAGDSEAAPAPANDGGGDGSSVFDLYDDFDISSMIRGDETWSELCEYHRSLTNPRLSFYVDKIAQKRWLPTLAARGAHGGEGGGGVDVVPYFVAKYASELFLDGDDDKAKTKEKKKKKKKKIKNKREKKEKTGERVEDDEEGADDASAVEKITRILDDVRDGKNDSNDDGRASAGSGFVAKVSHVSESNGVWVARGVDPDDGDKKLLRAYNVKDKEERRVTTSEIASSLAAHLKDRALEHESWALRNVRPGVVVERAFALWADESTQQDGEDGGDDDGESMPPFEFKVYVIWGRAYVARWRCRQTRGFVYRDGTMADWKRRGTAWRRNVTSLPSWLDWSRIVSMAEGLAAGKDMLRVDIFVGVPAGSKVLRRGVTRRERLDAVRYVVSECELFPTHTSDYKVLQPEMARLWIEGYKDEESRKYRVVPNPEVPSWFESRVTVDHSRR